MSLLRILTEIKGGESSGTDLRDLYEQLHTAISQKFRGTLRTMAGGELADRDGILTEAWEAVVRNAHGFRGTSEGEAYNYCKRAVTTRALDAFRKAGRRWILESEVRSSGTAEVEVENTERSEEGSIDVETNARRAEETRRLHEAMLRLKPVERQLLILVDFQGQKIREIAKATGEKENTLSVRRIRALAKLKAILEDRGF